MATNDDFYSPDLTSSLGDCNDIKSILKHSYVLPLGGIISCLCYLYIFHMYFIMKSPLLMRHPTTLAIYRCLFEFIFIQQYIWLPFIDSSHFYLPHSLDAGRCAATSTAAALAFFSQFSLLGSEVWFFVISYDLRMAYTNPFASFKQVRMRYISLVLSVALFTALLLLALGPDVYGPSPEGVLWIQNRKEEYNNEHPNYHKFILFYGWMLAIYVYCVYAIIYLKLKLRKGFAETLSAKLSIIQRASTYVVGYTIYWGILLSLEFISYAINRNSTAHVLVTAVAYGFSFRGVYSLAVILYTNRADISYATLSPFKSKIRKNIMENCLKEGLLLKPHLNSALRTEILYFTTQGIMFAAQECEKHHIGTHEISSSSSMENHDDDDRRTSLQQENKDEDPHHIINNVYSNTRKSVGLDMLERLSSRFSITRHNNDKDEDKNDDDKDMINIFAFKDKMEYNPRLTNILSSSSSSSSSSSAHHMRNTLTGKEVPMHSINRPSLCMMKISEQQSIAVAEEKIQEAEDEAHRMGMDHHMMKDDMGDDDLRDKDDDGNDDVEAGMMRSTTVASDIINQHHHHINKTKNTKSNSTTGSGELKAAIAGITKKQARPSSLTFTINPFHSIGRTHSTSSTMSAASVNHNMMVNDMMKNSVELAPISSSSSSPSSSSKLNHQHTSSSISSTDHRNSAASTSSQATRRWHHATDINISRSDMNDSDLMHNITSSSSSSTKPSSSVSSCYEMMSGMMTMMCRGLNKAAIAIVDSDYDEFKFKDFNPKQFARLRDMFGYPAQEYASSFLTTTKESFSEGRSGAFLFFSSDQRFIVKSTTKTEIQVLTRILTSYEQHFRSNPHSLLIKFLGAHCITMYGQDLYFVIMANVFPLTPLSERYDLKGSWVNRHRVASLKKSGGSTQRSQRRDKMKDVVSAPLLFDNDIQQKITLVPSIANSLAIQIANDITYLKNQGLMDYSLLVGVKRQRFEVVKEDTSSSSSNRRGSVIANPSSSSSSSSSSIDHHNPFQKEEDGGVRAAVVEGPGTFYFGIIDVLQEWNLKKKIERYFKVYVLGVDADGLSAIEPDIYASRFFHGAVLDFFDGINDNDEHNDDHDNRRMNDILSSNCNRQLYRRSCKGIISSSSSSPLLPPKKATITASMFIPINNNDHQHDNDTHQDAGNDAAAADDDVVENNMTTYVMKDDKSFEKYRQDHSRSRSVVGSIFPFAATSSSSSSSADTDVLSSSPSASSSSAAAATTAKVPTRTSMSPSFLSSTVMSSLKALQSLSNNNSDVSIEDKSDVADKRTPSPMV